MGEDIFTIITIIGTVSTTVLGVVAVITLVVANSKKIKTRFKVWAKEIFGIKEIADKLDKHLDNDTVKFKHLEEQGAKREIILKNQSEGLLSLLRTKLLYSCNECVDKGFVTFKEREVITQMWEAYRELNGNSFMKDLIIRILDLPITKNKF